MWQQSEGVETMAEPMMVTEIAIPQRRNAVKKVEPPQGPQPTSLIDLINAVVSRPDVDVSKIGELLKMQKDAEAEAARRAYNAAMNAAQKEMGRISADAVNPQTRSKYASYAQLDRVLRPIYTQHGFAVSFNTSPDAPEQQVRVLATVTHEENHGVKQMVIRFARTSAAGS